MTEDQIAADAAALADDEEPDVLDQQLGELSREELEERYRDLVEIYKDAQVEYRSMSSGYLDMNKQLNVLRRGEMIRNIFDILRDGSDKRYQLSLESTKHNNFSHIPLDEISHILIREQRSKQRWKLTLE